jgi:hypothetical protein
VNKLKDERVLNSIRDMYQKIRSLRGIIKGASTPRKTKPSESEDINGRILYLKQAFCGLFSAQEDTFTDCSIRLLMRLDQAVVSPTLQQLRSLVILAQPTTFCII